MTAPAFSSGAAFMKRVTLTFLGRETGLPQRLVIGFLA